MRHFTCGFALMPTLQLYSYVASLHIPPALLFNNNDLDFHPQYSLAIYHALH